MLDAAKRAAMYRKIAWRLIPFLFVCYIVNFVDRTNIGFAQLALKEQLDFSNAIYGLGAGLFYVGYILFEVPSNLLLQRTGARRTILRIMVLWGLLSISMAAVKTPGHFYLVRFLLGAAEAGFMPGILFYLSCWIPAARRARFIALFMLAIPLSGVIGSPISGSIMQSMEHVASLHGWQWMFILEGAPAVLLGIVAWFVLADGPAQAPWLSGDEKHELEKSLRDEYRDPQPSHASGGWRIARNPKLYLLAFFCVAMNGSIGGFSFWLPTIIRSFGVKNPATIGWIAVVPYALGAVVLYCNGRHSDSTGERRWHATLSLGLASGGWLLLPAVQHSPILAMLLVTIATAGTLGTLACFWSLVPLYFPNERALAYATVSSLGSLGSLASPIVVGWIASATGSVFLGTLYLGGLMLLASITLLAATSRDRSSRYVTSRSVTD